jgi:hypothetical protein
LGFIKALYILMLDLHVFGMDNNEKEAAFFGFTKSMRTGFFTAILGFSFVLNVYLFSEIKDLQIDKVQMQEKLYERVIETLRPTVQKMNNVADKVDTVADQASNAASKVDSVSNLIIDKNK